MAKLTIHSFACPYSLDSTRPSSGDLKEFFHVADNHWRVRNGESPQELPEALESSRKALDDFIEQINGLADRILRGLSVALKVRPDLSDDQCEIWLTWLPVEARILDESAQGRVSCGFTHNDFHADKSLDSTDSVCSTIHLLKWNKMESTLIGKPIHFEAHDYRLTDFL